MSCYAKFFFLTAVAVSAPLYECFIKLKSRILFIFEATWHIIYFLLHIIWLYGRPLRLDRENSERIVKLDSTCEIQDGEPPTDPLNCASHRRKHLLLDFARFHQKLVRLIHNCTCSLQKLQRTLRHWMNDSGQFKDFHWKKEKETFVWYKYLFSLLLNYFGFLYFLYYCFY